MSETEPAADTPEPNPTESWMAAVARLSAHVTKWVQAHAASSIAICLVPAGLAVLFPNFWIQCFCLVWGLLNLIILARVMLVARDMPSGRRLLVSFASIIAVSQMFGAAYAATLLSSDSFRHFRFSEYSPAADFNDRRLAAELLADIHARSVGQLNAYIAWHIESGKAVPETYPFETRLLDRPCPNDGTLLMVFYACGDPLAEPPPRTKVYKAELWFDALFEIEKFSDDIWIMKTDDDRSSVVAALQPGDPRTAFFDNSGDALLTFLYRLEQLDRAVPTRADRRLVIEYLSGIAKSTLRDFEYRDSLLPRDSVFTGGYNQEVDRLVWAVADTLLCMQYPSPRFKDAACEPVGEFKQWVPEERWESPDSRPGAILASLAPLDHFLTAYLTEILYWDIRAMEDQNDRRDMVINGLVFSAMAVMTSGFSDMSPLSYLAKTLLIFQFLAYVILIILILPMSFERPKEEP